MNIPGELGQHFWEDKLYYQKRYNLSMYKHLSIYVIVHKQMGNEVHSAQNI